MAETKWHIGEGYTKEQEAELDRLYNEYLNWSYCDGLNRHQNEPLRLKVTAAERAYDAKKAEFDEWKRATFGDDDPHVFSTYFNEAR